MALLGVEDREATEDTLPAEEGTESGIDEDAADDGVGAEEGVEEGVLLWAEETGGTYPHVAFSGSPHITSPSGNHLRASEVSEGTRGSLRQLCSVDGGGLAPQNRLSSFVVSSR